MNGETTDEFDFLFHKDPNRTRTVDVLDHLKAGRIILSGGRDRRGGPIVTFPGRSDPIPSAEEADRLLKYLASIPRENVRDLGFTVIVDMRTKDFGAMRSLLKILQRSFSAEIHMIYVVKPDGFWQNRRASVMSTKKYAFEVAMVSQPGDLRRHFHPMQLTTDLQGELNHDQEAWVMMQMMIESLHNDVMDLGTRYVKWDALLTRSGVSSLTESEIEAQLSEHLTIERLLNATNVEAFRERIREIVVELDRQNKARGIANPDFEAEKMKLEDLIGKLDAKRKRMEGAWQAKIETLQSCLQRKQLDEKIEKLIEWYDEKADIFEREMGDIGQSLEDAKLILNELEEIKAEAKKTEVLVKDVTESGARLLKEGSCGSVEVKLSNLSQAIAKLNEMTSKRETLLQQLMQFHEKTKAFYDVVDEWKAQFSFSRSLPEESSRVEDQIYGCKAIREKLGERLNEARRDGDELREKAKGCHHERALAQRVKETIERMAGESEGLEKTWQEKMRDLSQGLALRLFEREAEKVYSWIDDVGLIYLGRSDRIGDDYESAMSLLEEHKTVEANAQIMHGTSDRLLTSSEELAVHGQVKVDEIRQVADQLEERVHEILTKFERRREQLELSVAFYRTANELTKWMDSVEEDLHEAGYPEAVNDVETCVSARRSQRKNSAVQTANTLAQGQTLLGRLSTPSPASEYYENKRKIGNVMEQLQGRHAGLDSTLANRITRLELCLMMRRFEEAAFEHHRELDLYMRSCEAEDLASDVDGAVRMAQEHNAVTESVEEAYTSVTEAGHNLLERLGETMISLNASSTSSESASSHIRRLLTSLGEKFTCAQAAGQTRSDLLDQCCQFQEFEANVKEVVGGISDSYQGLVDSRKIVAKTLDRAESLLKEHESFEMSLDAMQDSVQELEAQVDEFVASDHYAKERISDLVESLREQWKVFAQVVDDRHTLLTIAHDIHRHHENLSGQAIALQYEFGSATLPESRSEAESLIEEHKRQREYFAQDCTRFGSDAQYLLNQLNELVLAEYCTDTDQIIDAQYLENEERVDVMLEGMKSRERRVIRLWEKRLAALEQHVKMLDFTRNAKKVCDWLYDANQWLTDHQSLGDSLELVDELLKASRDYEMGEVEEYHQLTLQLMEKASELEKTDRSDGSRLKVRVQVLNGSWEEFDARIKEHRAKLKISKKFFTNLEEIMSQRKKAMDFLLEMDNRAERCDSSSSVQSLSDETVDKHEQTMSSIESSLSTLLGLSAKLRDEQLSTRADLTSAQCNGLAREFSVRTEKLRTLKGKHEQIEKELDEKKRMERRKDLLMQEMMDTEEGYVSDLDYVLVNYVAEMQKDGPVALIGREQDVLGNLREIWTFHKETFFVALKEARESSEKLAECFVAWKEKILGLYLTYCRNQPRSAALLAEKAQDFLTEWQLSRGHAIALGGYLIKPIQRITRYHLLLHELKKYVEKLDEPRANLEMAYSMMRDIPKRTNDVMSLALVKDYDGNLDDLGELHHQGMYTVLDTKAFRSKEKERQVFLFEQGILIAKIEKDSFGNPSKYFFRMLIKTKEMMLTEFVEHCPAKFSISTGKFLSEKYIFKAMSIEAKQDTVKQIRTILQFVNPIPGNLDFNKGMTLRRSFKTKKRRVISASVTPTSESKALVGNAFSSLHRSPSDPSLAENELPTPSTERKGSTLPASSPRTPNAKKTSKKKKKDSIFVASALANLMAGALASPKSANVETPSPPPPPLAEEKTAIEIPPVEETTKTNFEMPPEGTEATILLTPEEKNPPIPASEEKDETHVKIELEEKLVDVRRDNDNATTAKIEVDEASPSSDFRRKRTRRLGLSRRRGPLRRQQENIEEEHQTNLVELIPRDIEAAKDEEVEEPVPTVKGVYVVCADYEALGDDDMSVSEGQKLEVIDVEQGEWWYARTVGEEPKSSSPTTYGWVPASYLENVDTTKQHSNGDAITEQQPSSQVRTPPLSRPPQNLWRKRKFAFKKESRSSLDAPSAENFVFSRKKFQATPRKRSAELQKHYSLENQRQYVLRELLDTERDYVRNLAKVIHTYGQELSSPRSPEALRGKYGLIFGNMEQIYRFHWNTLLPALEECDGVVEVASCFAAQKEDFQHLYVAYCENKPKSESILANYQGTFIEDVQQQLGDRLSLSDYLIKPVQRVTKYQLLFRDLEKYSRRLDCPQGEIEKVQHTWQIMVEVPKRANDVISLGLIEDFIGNIHALGDLLLREDFLVTDVQEGKKRMQKKRHVFLLEQVLIVTKEKSDMGMTRAFSTRDSMKLKSVGLNTDVVSSGIGDNALKFEIWVGKSENPCQKYEFQASSPEIKKQWTEKIASLLQDQLDTIEALKKISTLPQQRKSRSSSSGGKQSLYTRIKQIQNLGSSEDDLIDEEDQWSDLPTPQDLYVAVDTYVASADDSAQEILSFNKGQIFEVLEKKPDNGGWWLVKKVPRGESSAIEGWAPADYLDPKPVEVDKQVPDSSNLKPPEAGEEGGSGALKGSGSLWRRGSFRHRNRPVLSEEELSDLYDIEEELGKGRFSVVKKCVEISTGDVFAAKIFKTRPNLEEFVESEITILHHLKHERIVGFHKAFRTSRTCAIILEMIDGEQLFEHVVQNEDFCEDMAVTYVKDLLEALGFIHSKNMAHLDIKPENIMATYAAERFLIKLVDFGSACKITSTDQAKVAELIGPTEFFAPEVLRGNAVSLATDMWSLGAVVFTMAVGTSPFHGENINATTSKVLRGECSYEGSAWEAVSLSLKEFVRGLLMESESERMSVSDCLAHDWMITSPAKQKLDTSKLKAFVARRKWQRQMTEEVVIGSESAYS